MKQSNMIDWTETAQRLEAVAAALEQIAARIAEQHTALAAEAQESVGRIVATVESAREAELERRLEEAEARIAELTAAAAPAGRKTLPSGMASMLAKQGVALQSVGDSMEAGAIDAALSSLSIEQRIAVKAELLRAGLLG
jgi:paraquat-inducible protein B